MSRDILQAISGEMARDLLRCSLDLAVTITAIGCLGTPSRPLSGESGQKLLLCSKGSAVRLLFLSPLVGKTAPIRTNGQKLQNLQECLLIQQAFSPVPPLLPVLPDWYLCLPSLTGPRHNPGNRARIVPFGPRPRENTGPFSNRCPIPSDTSGRSPVTRFARHRGRRRPLSANELQLWNLPVPSKLAIGGSHTHLQVIAAVGGRSQFNEQSNRSGPVL